MATAPPGVAASGVVAGEAFRGALAAFQRRKTPADGKWISCRVVGPAKGGGVARTPKGEGGLEVAGAHAARAVLGSLNAGRGVF